MLGIDIEQAFLSVIWVDASVVLLTSELCGILRWMLSCYCAVNNRERKKRKLVLEILFYNLLF